MSLKVLAWPELLDNAKSLGQFFSCPGPRKTLWQFSHVYGWNKAIMYDWSPMCGHKNEGFFFFLLKYRLCDHPPRARHPGVQSQVGLRKHHYEQSLWMWWNSIELFQILKDDVVKVLHSVCQQIWKTQQWPQDWRRSVFISIPKKGNVKECSNYHTVAFISHASKVVLKIL